MKPRNRLACELIAGGAALLVCAGLLIDKFYHAGHGFGDSWSDYGATAWTLRGLGAVCILLGLFILSVENEP